MSTGHHSKNQEQQLLLEQFIKLRPIRAVDRMFTEHTVDKVYGLYHHLQDKIKRNTTDLRNTLTQKYQNLVDCSNLLITIQTFTHQIQLIQQDISHIFHQNPLETQLQHPAHPATLINSIEQTLYQKHFARAMQLTQSPLHLQLDQSQQLYLPFLRMQILEHLEEELSSKKITEKFILEIINCLTTYIKHLSPAETAQIISNADQFQQGTILSLLASSFQGQEQGLLLSQGDILQIVFKCKLFSLNRSQKGVKEEQKISKFFHDVYRLIGEKGRSNQQINRLASIFCRNLGQIQKHLSETFITGGQGQIISFRYELYEQLLSTQSFLHILDSLHTIIAQHYEQTPKLSLRQSFLNLWNNYYQYLLQEILLKCDPTANLPKQEQKDPHMPKQLAKYFKTDIIISKYLEAYKSELNLLVGNLKQILRKTQDLGRKTINQAQIMKQIKIFYVSKIKQLNQRVRQCQNQLSKHISQKNLNSVLLLFFFCDQFNSIFQGQGHSAHLKELAEQKLSWNSAIIQNFSLVFYKEYDQNWSISFDRFFMNFNPSTLSESKMQIVRKSILAIIEGMMRSKDAERANAIINQYQDKISKQQKEQVEKKSRLPDLPQSLQEQAIFAKKK